MNWKLVDNSATFKEYTSLDYISADGTDVTITIDTFEKKVKLNCFGITNDSIIEIGERDMDIMFMFLFAEDDDFIEKSFKVASHFCELLELPSEADNIDIEDLDENL